MPAFFFGTYTSTVVLNNPGTQNPATVGTSGFINVNSTAAYTPGILGTNSFPWTLTNNGTVQSVGSLGIGVSFTSGGTVTNAPVQTFSTAGPGPIVGGVILGTERGVWINGAAGSVNNSGTISQIGSPAAVLIPDGVFLSFGGTVNNTGTISSQSPSGHGVDLGAIGPGTLTNSGTISAVVGVSAGAGGAITNNNIGSIQASSIGIQVSGTTGAAVANFGTVRAVGTNAFPNGILTQPNGSTVTNSGTVFVGAFGGGANGISLNGGGVVNNSGLINAAYGQTKMASSARSSPARR